MPIVRRSAVVQAGPELAYRVVADVRRYPEFLPDLSRAEQEDDLVELEIRAGPLTIAFLTRVVSDPPREIAFRLVRGPFRHFAGRWRFESVDGATRITYELDFEPKLGLPGAGRVLSAALERNVERGLQAFKARIESAE